MTNPGPQYQPQQPGQPYPPQEQPKKKRGGCMKWGLIILGVLILIAVIVSVAGGGGGDDESEPADTGTNEQQGDQSEDAPAEAEQSGHTLRWEVETSDGSPANVTWMGANMNMSQNQGAATPWTQEVQADSKWDLIGANMNAQNQGSGDITCRVYWDDEVVNENTSSGEYAMVTCTLPN